MKKRKPVCEGRSRCKTRVQPAPVVSIEWSEEDDVHLLEDDVAVLFCPWCGRPLSRKVRLEEVKRGW